LSGNAPANSAHFGVAPIAAMVGQVDRQRLVPQRFGIDIGEEVATADEHVDGGHDLRARGGHEQRGVVPHAERDGFRSGGRWKNRSISSNSFTPGL